MQLPRISHNPTRSAFFGNRRGSADITRCSSHEPELLDISYFIGHY